MSRVVVVGAGPAGLSLAIAWLQRGGSVELIEQRSRERFMADAGGAYELTANTLRYLDALGVLAAIRERGTELSRFQLRTLRGATLQSLDFAKAGFTVFAITRAELQSVLFERFISLGGQARFADKPVSIETHAKATELGLESGASVVADVLVGADGMHSRVRQLVFDPAPPVDVGIAALWGRADVSALALGRGESLGWVGAGRSLVVASARTAGAPRLLFTLCAADTSPLDRAQHFSALPVSLAPLRASMSEVAETRLYAQRSLPSYAKGRALLIGDSAHGMPPFLGLGANLAIEDGVLAAEAIAGDSLASFGRARALHITPRIAESQRLGAMMHARSALGSGLFAAVTRLIPSALVLRQMRALHRRS
ncbi:MAG: NAD(P)/FAD-dependent oxidoreductase [Deltaproteobacteria bacterium]|nr:NAD(P)/FAD-dependent oxidoreductase [Deltaproteobacteria bacterium]